MMACDAAIKAVERAISGGFLLTKREIWATVGWWTQETTDEAVTVLFELGVIKRAYDGSRFYVPASAAGRLIERTILPPV